MAAQEIKVPDIGDFDSVEVIEVLVSAGDTVEKEQPLITLESDKATLEVPSTVAGKITELKVSEGSTVSEGDVIAMIEAGDDAGSGDDADETGDKAEAEQSSEDDAEPEQASAETGNGGDESSGGDTIEVKVPDIGDFDSVEVIEVLVAEGDTVEKEQPLITLESDKATLEVPSTAAGRVTGLKVAEGSTVSEGDVIALLESSGGGQSSSAKTQPQSGGDRQAAGSSQSKSGSDQAKKTARRQAQRRAVDVAFGHRAQGRRAARCQPSRRRPVSAQVGG